MPLINKLQKADSFLHNITKKGVNITKKTVKVTSEKAKEAEQSLQNNERFLSDDTYAKINKFAQETTQKAKNLWTKLTS